MTKRLDFGSLAPLAHVFDERLAAIKRRLAPADFAWYPYDTLGSFYELEKLPGAGQHCLRDLAGNDPILDVGCADGDIAFFLESLGFSVTAIDYPLTNYNGMRGVSAMKEALGSRVQIRNADLDTQFSLLDARYGAVFLFGVLYHLKNPFYVLETLARHARYCFLTTRIARFTPVDPVDLRSQPVGYLVGRAETNQDETNYWIFSENGLGRLLDRCQWELCDYLALGNTTASNPATWSGDERAFCIARSRVVHRVVELLEGWHELEENTWRWTARRFAAKILNPPANRSAILRLRFAWPEAAASALGSVTLSVRAAGRMLSTESYRQAGEYTSSTTLQAEILNGEPLTIEFELDRALPPTAGDSRELGVIVSVLDVE